MADSTLALLNQITTGNIDGTELLYTDDGVSDLKMTLDQVRTFAGQLSQNSKSANYTTVLSDANGHILHPLADANNRTFTIDSNVNVGYPVGTFITFVNEANALTIAITSDTMTLAGGTSTGSRTLAAYGIATALKTGTTRWIISGVNLT